MTDMDIKQLGDELRAFIAKHEAEQKKIAAEMHGLPEAYKSVKANIEEHAKSFEDIKGVIADLQRRAALGTEVKPNLTTNKSYIDFVRTGAVDAKNLAISNQGSAGFLVAPEYVTQIIDMERNFDPIRPYCSQTSINAQVAKIPVDTTDAATQWVGETDTRPVTTPPEGAIKDIMVHHVNVFVAPTRDLLIDGFVNVESWLTNKLVESLARAESAAFVDGTGTGRPHGLFRATGMHSVTGAITADNLIDLWGKVTTETDKNATYVLNKATAVTMRKFKDTSGQYLWNPPLANGMPPTFNGFEALICGSAPNAQAVFGNLKKYQIVDRMDMTILRDEYTKKNENKIEFMMQKRVGGAVMQPTSFAILKATA